LASGKRIEMFPSGGDFKKRVEIIDKKNPNGIPSGTTVILLIPIQKNNVD
jgi:hypothetical protein